MKKMQDYENISTSTPIYCRICAAFTSVKAHKGLLWWTYLMSDANQDRATRVLHLLLRNGESSIEELAAEVGASTASVRRDLIKLEERGLVNRTLGGAEVAGKMGYAPFRFDAAFPLREERFADEKRRIALAAAAMIDDGDTIALSPGTTTTAIARSLRHRVGLHIVTSAVNIGMELSSLPNMNVTLTGGSVRWPGSFSMVGATAFDSLQRLFFERVFMGACGIHPEHGLTVIESDEALILSEMSRHAKQVIAVVDSSKMGMISAMQVCTVSQIDIIITDTSADPVVVESFTRRKVRVVLV